MIFVSHLNFKVTSPTFPPQKDYQNTKCQVVSPVSYKLVDFWHSILFIISYPWLIFLFFAMVIITAISRFTLFVILDLEFLLVCWKSHHPSRRLFLMLRVVHLPITHPCHLKLTFPQTSHLTLCICFSSTVNNWNGNSQKCSPMIFIMC